MCVCEMLEMRKVNAYFSSFVENVHFDRTKESSMYGVFLFTLTSKGLIAAESEQDRLRQV